MLPSSSYSSLCDLSLPHCHPHISNHELVCTAVGVFACNRYILSSSYRILDTRSTIYLERSMNDHYLYQFTCVVHNTNILQLPVYKLLSVYHSCVVCICVWCTHKYWFAHISCLCYGEFILRKQNKWCIVTRPCCCCYYFICNKCNVCLGNLTDIWAIILIHQTRCWVFSAKILFWRH